MELSVHREAGLPILTKSLGGTRYCRPDYLWGPDSLAIITRRVQYYGLGMSDAILRHMQKQLGVLRRGWWSEDRKERKRGQRLRNVFPSTPTVTLANRSVAICQSSKRED